MRYYVTIEPRDRLAHPQAPAVRSIVEAADKDAALDDVEAAYRRRYPGIEKLTVHVVRLRPRP